jgi:crotonobetainyl-CoA:carnitine CoA-transferase CaiB-like acyl-CoA transferase
MRGVELVSLDLKAPADRDKLDSMPGDSDLLITATRPAALERLGLGWAALHAGFPRLCHVAITGYPPPEEDVAGHDLNYQARHGLVQPPAMPRSLVADLGGAERAVTEALALLHARNRTGTGGQRLVALSDAAAAFAAPVRHRVTAPDMFLGGALPNYRIYAAKEGHIAVGALEGHFLMRLLEALGLDHPEHAVFERVFAERTDLEWEAWAAGHGLPVCACR